MALDYHVLTSKEFFSLTADELRQAILNCDQLVGRRSDGELELIDRGEFNRAVRSIGFARPEETRDE
jgi:hypothetical protein